MTMTTADTHSTELRRLGIMGGGQLGMFLCQSARELGVKSIVHEANPSGSALPYADEAIVADQQRVGRYVNRWLEIDAAEIDAGVLGSRPQGHVDLLAGVQADTGRPDSRLERTLSQHSHSEIFLKACTGQAPATS